MVVKAVVGGSKMFLYRIVRSPKLLLVPLRRIAATILLFSTYIILIGSPPFAPPPSSLWQAICRPESGLLTPDSVTDTVTDLAYFFMYI